MSKSSYYYDYTRNCKCDECVCDKKDLIDNFAIPSYYLGNNGYEARKVVEGFELSYNVGTAVTYCLRSKRKHKDGGVEDLRKAINHLKFELEKLENSK